MGEGCSWRVGAHAQFLDQDFSNLACALLLQLQSLASQNRMKNSSERKVEAMNLTNVQEKVILIIATRNLNILANVVQIPGVNFLEHASKSNKDVLENIKFSKRSQSVTLANGVAAPIEGHDIFVARAPGRLDVMGGIADYSGSLVLQEACCKCPYGKTSNQGNIPTNNDGADSNDLRELEDKANLKPPSNLISLMQVYREAILNGDDKTVSDIEAKISIIEKEKNELV
ncbi:Ribosomal protein S5 domain 2-type fold [Forsythia ovata]|uniref:Ribosomal protein S5 domain 2-type fold n=1 Tax=Forsythia ovata TaxID=205694 RepID=A0ABD1WZR3_9LAMI